MFGMVLLLFVTRCTGVIAQDLCSFPSSKQGNYITAFEIRENLPVGSTVTHVKIHGTDSEIRLNVIEDNGYVKFDPVSRNITVAKSLIGQKEFDLIIGCSHGRIDKLPIKIVIIIQDINDNPPKFERSEYTAAMSELSPVGTTIITGISATDADNGNIHFTYELLPGPYSDYFDIPPSAKHATEGTEVRLKKVLDFESVRTLTVTIVAKDNHPSIPNVSDVKLNGTTTLIVNVLDGDDLDPEFTKDTYVLIIPENVSIGEELTVSPKLAASDGDKNINSSIEYSIVPDENLRESKFFSIDGKTGVMSLQKVPTVRGTRFALLIKASQTDKPERFGTALLHVIVQGANENKPTFLQKEYAVDVSESVPTGSAVFTVAAVDNDAGAILDYKLKQPNTFFRIDTKTGVITTSQPLDYEVTRQIRLVVVVSDGNWEDECSVTVNIQNVNDNNPIFTKKTYFFDVKERTKGGVVGSVKASDADTNSKLTYQVTDDTNLFSINELGEIRISEEGESLISDPVYKLMVTAMDEGSPPRQSSAFVVVTFPSIPPVTAAVKTQKEPDYVIIIILAVLAGLLLFIIVAMVIYIAKSRFYSNPRDPVVRSRSFDGKMNIAGKRHHSNPYDPKGLTYSQKTPSTDSNLHLTDNTMATSQQENPFDTESDSYNYAYINPSMANRDSDMSDYSSPPPPPQEHQENMRHVNEIEIETAVAPVGDNESLDSDTLPPPPQYMGTVPDSLSTFSDIVANGSIHSSLPDGSTLKMMDSGGRKQGVSFSDDIDRVNVYNPQNAVTARLQPEEKPGITVYY